MSTAAENLTTAFENACARLAELDTVPLTTRARMTYSDAGRTYGWNEYRAALLEQIRAYPEALKALQSSAGPFQVHVPPGW